MQRLKSTSFYLDKMLTGWFRNCKACNTARASGQVPTQLKKRESLSAAEKLRTHGVRAYSPLFN